MDVIATLVTEEFKVTFFGKDGTSELKTEYVKLVATKRQNQIILMFLVIHLMGETRMLMHLLHPIQPLQRSILRDHQSYTTRSP